MRIHEQCGAYCPDLHGPVMAPLLASDGSVVSSGNGHLMRWSVWQSFVVFNAVDILLECCTELHLGILGSSFAVMKICLFALC